MELIINKMVHVLRKEFADHPYDFVSAEVEAQVKIANYLRKEITDRMEVAISGSIPDIKNSQTETVKMEWGFNGFRNDVIVFKPKKYPREPLSYDDVRAAIEVKIGWDATKDHLEHNSIVKDFEFIQSQKDVGYLIMFLANKYSVMGKEWQEYYSDTFKKQSYKYGLKKNHGYIVFMDKILISE